MNIYKTIQSRLGDFFRNHPLIILSVLFFLLSIFLFIKNGIHLTNDSGRYLSYANNLKAQFYFDPHNFWYISYVGIIYFIQFFTEDLWILILFQYLMALISLIAIYKASFLLWNNKTTAFLVTLSYLLFIDLHQWHSYVMCESLYVSFTAIYLYLLLDVSSRKVFSIAWMALLSILLCFTMLLKPTGLGLLFGTLSFLFYTNIPSFSLYKLTLMGGIVFLVLCSLNFVLDEFQMVAIYQTGELVHFASRTDLKVSLLGTVIAVPNDLVLPSENGPIVQMLIFIFYNPIFFAKLFFGKLAFMISHIRPYWSYFHNTFSLAFLIPLYFFAIKGFKKLKNQRPLKSFGIVFILFHLFAVGFTISDWDGRFLLPVLPFLFIIAKPEFLPPKMKSTSNR